MTDLISLYKSTQTSAEFARAYLTYLTDILEVIDVSIIEQIINAFVRAAENDKTIYFLGNGGSAVTATHFASDMAVNTRTNQHKPLRAVSLVDNLALLTCVSNDEGFENIFIRQLEIFMQPGDVVVGLSVSGNSPNVINACQYAKDNGATVIACTGFSGGKIGSLADIHFHIPTPVGEYGPVEDIYQILDHLIYTYLRLSRIGSLSH
jgi:D-sedoheptulose 7-phosphate isomerase